MKIVIKQIAGEKCSAPEKKFTADNERLFRAIREELKNLLVEIADFNGILKSQRRYPVNTASSRLAMMNKAILSIRVSISLLDKKAKKTEVCVPELDAFKESLESVQDYYDNVAADFYILTAGSDIPKAEDEAEAPQKAGGDSPKVDGGEIELEIHGLENFSLSEEDRNKIADALSSIAPSLFLA